VFGKERLEGKRGPDMNFCGESMQIHYISCSRPFYEMHEWVAFPCSLAPLFHDVFVKSQPNRVTSAQIGGIAAPRDEAYPQGRPFTLSKFFVGELADHARGQSWNN
jgi:hypothetical protein